MAIWQSVKKVEIRQLAAIPYLYLIFGFAATASPPVNILDDLDGTAGLLLAFVPLLLFPRKWLPAAHLIVASYFLVVAVASVPIPLEGASWKIWLFPLASLVAAGIFVTCAAITKRMNRMTTN